MEKRNRSNKGSFSLHKHFIASVLTWFVFHFPAIWLITLNKPSGLTGCFILGAGLSFAEREMPLGQKWCDSWMSRTDESQLDRKIICDFEMDASHC